jgi:hypothetical protein
MPIAKDIGNTRADLGAIKRNLMWLRYASIERAETSKLYERLYVKRSLQRCDAAHSGSGQSTAGVAWRRELWFEGRKSHKG